MSLSLSSSVTLSEFPNFLNSRYLTCNMNNDDL